MFRKCIQGSSIEIGNTHFFINPIQLPSATGLDCCTVIGSSLDAAVISQRFRNMNSGAFVGQCGQTRSATAVAAGAFLVRAFVKQCKRLGQAVGAEPCLDALLAGEERVAAINVPGLCCERLQFLAQSLVDEHNASEPALGHVGQQSYFFFDYAILVCRV